VDNATTGMHTVWSITMHTILPSIHRDTMITAA